MSSMDFLNKLLDGVAVEWKVLGEVLKTGDFVAVAAQNLADRSVAGITGYHADFSGLFQILYRFDFFILRYQNHLGDFKIRISKGHGLLAFIIDGYC